VFKTGDSFESLGLTPDDVYEITGLNSIAPDSNLTVTASNGERKIRFDVIVKLNTDIEVEYIKNGGILHYVLRQMINQ
jgi:aconitate hydratase